MGPGAASSGGVPPAIAGAVQAQNMQSAIKQSTKSALRFAALKYASVVVRTQKPLAQRFQKSQAIKQQRAEAQKAAQAQEVKSVQKVSSSADQSAQEFSTQHQQAFPELESDALVRVHNQVLHAALRGASAEQILQEIQNFFRDPTAMDLAFTFLLDTIEDAQIRALLEEAQFLLHQDKEIERLILSGYNTVEATLRATKKLKRDADRVRKMYRKFTSPENQEESAAALFAQFLKEYPDEEERENVFDYFLSAMGAELKSIKTSISRGKLHDLTSRIRVIRAAKNVFRYFKESHKRMKSQLSKP